MRHIIALLLCFCTGGFSSALSQDSVHTVRLTVISNIANARVLVDSREIGLTPLQEFVVPEGRHTVCVLLPDGRRWIADAVCETVYVKEAFRLQVRLPRTITITSEPYGATVIYKDSILGNTPLLVSMQDDAGVLRLAKEGYHDVTVMFDPSVSVFHGILKLKETPAEHARWLYLEKEESQTIIPVVVSVSSAVLAGAMAAYWKLRADDVYKEYQRTGDTGRLHRVHNLDLASGIALGLSQVSLAFLTYLLVSE